MENNFDDISFNDNYDIWTEIRRKAAKNSIPIHGHFELTPKCNLNCKMCYVHLSENQFELVGKKELPFWQWKKIIDGAIEAGMIFASLSGGECLTSPLFDEIYLYLQSNGIMITVLTNGVLLDKKIDFFIENPPSYIQVSVYGKNENDYEKVTGHRVYNKVKKGVDEAIKAGLPIGIAITASRYLTNVKDIMLYYKKKGISVVVNQWLMAPYQETNRKIEDFWLTPQEQVEISKQIAEVNCEEIEPYDKELPRPNRNLPKSAHYGISCAAGRSDFNINWKGEMSLCVSLSKPTGYPLIQGFVEAWKNTKEKAETFLLPGECIECKLKSICHHCPAQHLLNAQTGHCNPDICKETELLLKCGLIKFEV